MSLYRRGTIAIVKIFLENLKYRTRRDSDLDPWAMRDMFRLNHTPMRELVIVQGDEEEGESLWVQHNSEYNFNVYCKDEDGSLIPVILDAECDLSETKPDQLIVRTDHHSYLVDYFMATKEYNVVTQLDYEGSPLPYRVKNTVLERDSEVDVTA